MATTTPPTTTTASPFFAPPRSAPADAAAAGGRVAVRVSGAAGMCGRLQLHQPAPVPARAVPGRAHGVEGHQPSWNVAPASDILVVTARPDGARELRACWGLVPRWAKDPGGANKMINPRAETARRRAGRAPPAALHHPHRRLTSGRTRAGPAALLHHPHLSPFPRPGRAVGTWRDPESAEELFTCTILTTSANDLMESVHHRMPVILSPRTGTPGSIPRTPTPRSWPSCSSPHPRSC